MNCTICKKSTKALFRTTLLGSPNAGWACKSCINKDKKLPSPDSDTVSLINDLLSFDGSWVDEK